MQAFVSACVVAVVIALGAAFVLGQYQRPAEQAFTTEAVRI